MGAKLNRWHCHNLSNWRALVVEEIDGTKVLVRQQLEIRIFSNLATEFKTGDACVVGSESYADFREQLLSHAVI